MGEADAIPIAAGGFARDYGILVWSHRQMLRHAKIIEEQNS